MSKAEDENVLVEVYRLLNLNIKPKEIYNFSEAQEKEIEEARAEIKAGKFLTDEEVNKEIREWLKSCTN